MASTLFGVQRTLTWADYRAVTTGPGGVPFSAQTIPDHRISGFNPQRISGSGTLFRVPDTIVVHIFLTPDSWRLNTMSEKWLLRHEQAHYDIYALMVRDWFHELRDMTRVPWTQDDIRSRLADLKETYLDEIPEIQKLYDGDTRNARDGEEQWVWWSVIRRAAELHRMPLTLGLDGRYLKLRLLDALEAAGLQT